MRAKGKLNPTEMRMKKLLGSPWSYSPSSKNKIWTQNICNRKELDRIMGVRELSRAGYGGSGGKERCGGRPT